MPTLGSYFLSTLPTPTFFPLTPAGATGQVWAANKTQTEKATQSYLPGSVRLGHAHHLAYISLSLPQGEISPGGRLCWCQANQPEEQYPGDAGRGSLVTLARTVSESWKVFGQ